MTITPAQLRESAASQRASAPDGATVPLADELEAAATEIECLSRPATWQEEQMGVEAAFERSGVTRPWPADEPDQLVPMADAMADEIARLRLTDAEREAVEKAIGWIESPGVEDEAMPDDYLPITATLRGLLARCAIGSASGGEIIENR